MVTNQNLIQKEIKRRLNSGNTCFHSVQNLLSSLLSKPVKIRMYRIIILVSEIKGGTRTEDVWEQGAEENILAEEG
jgi:hypothetical protein